MAASNNFDINENALNKQLSLKQIDEVDRFTKFVSIFGENLTTLTDPVCWTATGSIDAQLTLKKYILDNESINPIRRFFLASVFCCTDKIAELRNMCDKKVILQTLSDTQNMRRIDWYYFVLIQFWLNYNFQTGATDEDIMFICTIMQSTPNPFYGYDWFWDQMTAEQKVRIVENRDQS